MDKTMTDFIKGCLALAKELLAKNELTDKEKNLLGQLQLITKEYFKGKRDF
jgi:hypothetical protein